MCLNDIYCPCVLRSSIFFLELYSGRNVVENHILKLCKMAWLNILLGDVLIISLNFVCNLMSTSVIFGTWSQIIWSFVDYV